ncbi:hypothetical protein [Tranquillimonas alkanivorans]|uniref:PEP-CTERM protein-sorting domain-containing protein n=1 Tax=Tranquillimonas alkanivorans TaxID=441119 RepID=A0A1I5MLB3_9RHOB|nr:hypothetical protein [Tranquillimonas alkanivorans]SFP10313.1 hypothetical protein SAMN04488047_102319 [Tranquillimonas alkanivorans]
MIVLLFAAIGAVWGALLARRRGGKPLDMAQYGGGMAILGALIGLFVTIFITRAVS